MSNVLGTVNPVAELIRLAHDAGALVLLDGCQAIVHERVDVKALDVDFYVFSGHKLYGPDRDRRALWQGRAAGRLAAVSGWRRDDRPCDA
jgi:cysteine sulfinate desulfinase/cysteine desulfurase-like protein